MLEYPIFDARLALDQLIATGKGIGPSHPMSFPSGLPPLTTPTDGDQTNKQRPGVSSALPRICLSIVSHGQFEVALTMLLDLARIAPEAVARIVYTRNISEPPLPALDFGGIDLVIVDNPEPQGFSANHNAAFRHCQESHFCVMNPDLRFDKDPFPALLAAFAPPDLSGRKRMGLVAPVIIDPQGRLQNTARRLYTPGEMIRQKLSPSNHGQRADWLAGMFMLFRSEAYASIHGFDERYFLYIEDVDICSRLVVAGWQLTQVQTAQIVHHARKTSHRSLLYTRWHLAGMLRYWLGRSFRDYRRVLREQQAGHA